MYETTIREITSSDIHRHTPTEEPGKIPIDATEF